MALTLVGKELYGQPVSGFTQRAAVIRDAVGVHIAERARALGTDVFGMWKDRHAKGLSYQEKLRREW
ncbi:hypothetical protein [Mycetohabitans sp. B46]|uniref:hypothetical protein n=1 Tax=Mycetohabitans sp. B46 TaxID=2772536 RepID=UPI00307E9E21